MLNLVTDFDGTVTDVHKEAETFIEAYVEMMSRLIGMNGLELSERLLLAKELILANPSEFGWNYGGLIIAPATSDPYLLTQTSAMMVLTEEGDKNKSIPPKEEWDSLFNTLFAYAYPKAGVCFRPWALEYITALNTRAKLTVVTNSSTNAVLKKLSILLGSDQTVRVIGGAKKYSIDQDWSFVPKLTYIKGLERPVYLRRKCYGDVLVELGEVNGVCGDIWELDLALPERLGIYTALVLTDTTPEWERAHYLSFENGIASGSLEEIADILLTE